MWSIQNGQNELYRLYSNLVLNYIIKNSGVKMKKGSCLAILVFVVFVTSILYSQDALKKGSYSLSGSLTFSSSTNESMYDKIDQTSFVMTPGITYFVVDNFSAGLGISFGYYESNWKSNNQEIKYISRPVSFGPVIRYYFSVEKFIPFIEASYRYANSLQGNEDMNIYTFAGGINYFFAKSAALEPYIEYMKENYIVADQKQSGISIGLRINYFIID